MSVSRWCQCLFVSAFAKEAKGFFVSVSLFVRCRCSFWGVSEEVLCSVVAFYAPTVNPESIGCWS